MDVGAINPAGKILKDASPCPACRAYPEIFEQQAYSYSPVEWVIWCPYLWCGGTRKVSTQIADTREGAIAKWEEEVKFQKERREE